jgi:tetratricopeptide (TPR) repeat protein
VTHTDWVPGLLVLGLGLLTAFGVLLLGRRRSQAKRRPESRDEVDRGEAEEADLRSARLLEQLRELEADRHQLSEVAYQAESARLQREAADALRARDEASSAVRKPRTARPLPESPGYFRRHPQLVGALWGGGAVVFFGALFLLLKQDAQPRTQGEGLTGTVGRGEATAPTPPAEDPGFSAALARVRDDPSDLETSAHVVHELIRRQDYEEARLLTERSLGIDPFQSEARIHRAFLLAVGGDPQAASLQLQHLGALYPQASEALLFLGLLRMRTGDNRAAADAFERFLAEAPPDEQPPQMRAALVDLLQQLKSPR